LISSLDLGDQSQLINESMVKAIGRAHRWDKEFRLGKSMSEIAKAENVHRSYVGQVLPLAFLAPDIVEAILDGRQPQDLKVEQLLKALPIEWGAQRRALGFNIQ
jgi:site-specific DNA recombinase